MEIKNLIANIEVGDTELDELKVRLEDNKATCFIASNEGQIFRVFLVNETDYTTRSLVYVDGAFVGSLMIDPHSFGRKEGAHIDEQTMRPFTFASMQLSDDDDAVIPPRERLRTLGTIRIDVFRVTRAGLPQDFRAPRSGADILASPSKLHERTKKAGAHRVQLGEPVRTTKVARVNVEYIDPFEGEPYAQFTFTYRSREMLRAQGILVENRNVDPAARRAESPPQRPLRYRPRAVKRDAEGAEVPNIKRQCTESREPTPVRPKDEENEVENLLAERALLDELIRTAQMRAATVKREMSPIMLGDADGETIDLTAEH